MSSVVELCSWPMIDDTVGGVDAGGQHEGRRCMARAVQPGDRDARGFGYAPIAAVDHIG
jgi:hypothetical protein